MPALPASLYPLIQPNRHGMLAVDALHTIYWEEVGNPDGIPVIFLHGGPGAGLSVQHRRFFDPKAYRIILFDQRGAGKSTPLGEWRDNTTQHLIADIEQLRTMMGIEQWLVFGGSWGSTLALAYGEAHPDRCLGFVLRGVFLCTPREIEWFLHGAEYFHPEIYDEFVSHIPPTERADLLNAYARRILCDDPALYWPAVRAWSKFEGRRVFMMPQEEEPSSDTLDLGVGRLELHYMANLGFFEPDQLLRNVGAIAHLPCVIVHGRYDVICPPVSAQRLHEAWPASRLRIIPDAGHSALESGIARELVAATDTFKRTRQFAQ